MSSVLSALHVASGTLAAFDQAMVVTENNVANASTPGFVEQTQTFTAMPFNSTEGLTGGVRAGEVVNARDQYDEQAVWQQNSLLGEAQQQVNTLTGLQNSFDVTGATGISKALNDFYTSVSAWGQSPTDPTARQTVLNQAGEVANAFQQAAAGLSQATTDVNTQLQQTVTQVNQLVGQLQGDNQQILQGDRNDAGLEAQVYSTLEQLSQYVNISATPQPDGSVTVLLAGQTPLLIGGQQYQIGAQLTQPDWSAGSNAPPLAQIIGSDGSDITSTVTSGQLGGLVNLRNNILPTYIGSASQQGSLNTMAQQFADTVNGIFEAGNITDAIPGDANGDGAVPAVTGVPLFVYDTNADGTVNATNVAQSLAVNPGITTSQLAAITPGPPEVANGVPLALAGLANPQSTTDEIDGMSFTQYYGKMAADVGTNLQNATNDQQLRQSSLAQAQNLRQQQTGVNLDGEAMTLVEFQRAYEANAQMITVLNQITQDTINILAASSTA
jgi:flagellar hook-associated protein 1 FlgK